MRRSHAWLMTALVALAEVGALGAWAARAAEAPGMPPAPPEKAPPPPPEKAPPLPLEKAAPAADAPPSAIKEQSVYIPYAKLREVFEKEGRGVFLPYEKFRALWEAAREKTAPPAEAKPPVDALIAEVDAKATVSKDVVTVTATVKVEVLKEGWVEVPLRLSDAALVKATLEGQPARIVSEAGGGYKLLVEKKGKAPQALMLALEFAKAYTKAPGQNSVSFETPQAPVSKWEVRIPESGVKVNVQPLLAATEVPPAGGAKADETVVLAFVGAAPSVRLDWTPKAEGAKGLEALAAVQVHQQTSIEEGVTRTRAQLAYDISRAELVRLEVEVPADQKVVNVFDPNVREWTVAPAGAVQKVAVQLFEPARQTQSLVVELEKFAEPGAAPDVRVPVVKALGVGRQQGVVVVQVSAGLRAEAAEAAGLLQLDAADLPAALARGRWDFSYRYAALPFTLALRVEKILPRILADSLVEVHLAPEALTLELATVYTIERAGVFRLELDLPEGYDVRAVVGTAIGKAQPVQVDTHHLEGEKKTRLVVNLSRKALGRVALAVRLHRALREPDLLAPTGKAADLPLALPRVVPATVERETGRLVIYAPESLRVNPARTDGLQSIPFAEAVRDMRSTQRGDQERPVLAFAYTQEPASLALAAERRKPHLTVRQLLVARIDSGVVKYEATFFYDVLYSGVKSLRIDVPKDLSPDLRVTSAGIRHEVVTDPQAAADAAKDYLAWKLAGEAEFLGPVQVRLAWERKIEKLDTGKSVTLAVPRLIPREVDRAWGQVVLAKAETIDVHEGDPKEGLRPIDPQHDLMPGAAVPGAARAFEFHEDWALAVVATRYELEEVKRTSVERALVRMVLTKSDQTGVQALYRMRSARQRLLVQLPAGVEFATDPLRLNGRPVALERGEAESRQFYVPLVGQSPDAPFLLELRYTVKGAGLRLDCPTFPEEPAVQQVHLSVWLPPEWDYLGSCGPWTDELVWRLGDYGVEPWARQSDHVLLVRLREGIAVEGDPEQGFPTDGRPYLFSTLRPPPPPEGSLRLVTMHGDWLAVLVIAAVLAAGIALVPARAGVRCVAVGAFAAALVLAAVFLPTLARQVIDGAMGAAAFIVLVLWGLWHLLVTWPRRRASRSAPPAGGGPGAGTPPARGPGAPGSAAGTGGGAPSVGAAGPSAGEAEGAPPPGGPPPARSRDEGGSSHA